MEARQFQFQSPRIAGISLHAAEWGDHRLAPTIVLLHGGGANLHWWDHIAPALTRDFRVVALDFRGHGDSDHPRALEPGAFQRDLEALLEHVGAEDIVLVGHSMGGHVALHHAAHHDGVRALVAIEVSRGAPKRERRRMRLALAARRTYRTRQEAIERYRFLPPAPAAAESLRQAIAARSVREEEGRFGYKFDPRWFGMPASAPPPLERVACPCLIVRGSDSTLLTREGADALARELRDARVVEIPGCGHNVHLERPDEVTRAILEHATHPL
jgi:pimeloyl-ACP methyl ester carboxylesterase